MDYNPNNTFEYGIVTEQRWRNLQNISFDALSVELYKYPLNPLETAKIFIDFSKMPENMIYNVHYKIVIKDIEENELELPYYFNPDINNITDKNWKLQIWLHNM